MPASDQRKRDQTDLSDLTDASGALKRPTASFRNRISSAPGAPYTPESGRYALYISPGCPWAHRTNIVRHLKGLEDHIQLIRLDVMGPEGWYYSERAGSDPYDLIHGSEFKLHRQLYALADPNYTGRYTVPVLFDTKTDTIVSNESSEIIRMFYGEFDSMLPADSPLRAANQPHGGLFPENLRDRIEDMNAWVYPNLNNGVYRAGIATSQAAYDEAVTDVFAALDRMEEILKNGPGPFVLGAHLTEADIRLYPTIARFDVAYNTTFQCNLKSIRHDYPYLNRWLQRLYWDRSEETNWGAFGKTTDLERIKEGYAKAKKMHVPIGPVPGILPRGEGAQP